jgi:hypothetical protein
MEPVGFTDIRRLFFRALFQRLAIMWPVLSGIMAAIASLGALVGIFEGWGIAPGIYFSFVTGLTIGYGDLAPSGPVTRVLAVAIGLLGILLTGLVAALAVSAFEATPIGRERPMARQPVRGG